MKFQWRYAICCILVNAGIIMYVWRYKSAMLEKLIFEIYPHQYGAEEPFMTENADSGRCKASCHDNQCEESCRTYLTCQHIKEITLEKKIGGGVVKQVYLGRWQGMKVVYSSLTHPRYLEDFLHGAEMLQAMQPSKFVVRLLGLCLDASTPVIVTKYYRHGSGENIDDVLAQEGFSEKNTIRTRFQMCLDYAHILSFLHSSPVGTRVMCDSNDVRKTLSQFLITDELHLVINDLDALPLVDHEQNKLIKCGHRQLYGDFVAPEQLWPFPDRNFQDEDMPPYDEKTDIWKIPDVTDALLGDVDQGNIVRFHLFKIHNQCKELDPARRPTADEILKVYLEIFDSIINNNQ